MIEIVPQATYLGMSIGLGAAHHSWQAPITKWIDRSHALAADAPPAAALAKIYTMRCVSVLTYIASTLPPPSLLCPSASAIFMPKCFIFLGTRCANMHTSSSRGGWGGPLSHRPLCHVASH